jgi:hypothetical protein
MSVLLLNAGPNDKVSSYEFRMITSIRTDTKLIKSGFLTIFNIFWWNVSIIIILTVNPLNSSCRLES